MQTAVAVAIKMFFEADMNYAITEHYELFYSKALLFCMQGNHLPSCLVLIQSSIMLKMAFIVALHCEGHVCQSDAGNNADRNVVQSRSGRWPARSRRS